MKNWLRRQVDQLCNHLGDLFDFTFGIPVTLHFGDVPFEGFELSVSRSDHVHGMPAAPNAIIDAYGTAAFQFTECMGFNGAGSATVEAENGLLTVIGGARTFNVTIAAPDVDDDVGPNFGFGVVGINLATASPSQSSGLIVLSQDTSGDTFLKQFYAKRMTILSIRARFGRSAGTVVQGKPFASRCIVGAFRTQTITLGVSGWLDDLYDGLYFRADFNASGSANWFAVAQDSGALTQVDTGITIEVPITSSQPSYQIFDIVLSEDKTKAAFVIDDVIVATIDENIPQGKVFGFGCAMEHKPRTNSHFMRVDSIEYNGNRVAA